MRGLRTGLIFLSMAVGLLVVSARLTLRAQERRDEERTRAETLRLEEQATPRLAPPVDPGPRTPEAEPVTPSVQDALQRPFTMPFARPTSLTEVTEYLRRTLRAPVVLDVAALERQELKPEDEVQLQLEGVRLKTSLKILLDQVGLTYQVVPEDNLLLLTDVDGSTDPIDRILSEIKALHRDVHDLQDSVDDIKWSLGLDEEEGGATMRKPTIIEEVPAEGKPGEKPEPVPPAKAERPRTRAGI